MWCQPVRTVAVACAALAVAGCGDETAPESTPPPRAGCERGEFAHPTDGCCPAGTVANAAGGCCPAGTTPLEEGGCQPAGIQPGQCATGFEPDGDAGCEPILPRVPCPAGQLAVPGDAACRDVAPCGSGTWGDIPVAADTQHVDASYTGGNNDGSASRPWTRIQDGIDAVSPGAIVAVAAGSYEQNLMVAGKTLRLWGRCPAMTEVRSALEAEGAVFVGQGADGSELRDLALTRTTIGVEITGARQVLLDRLRIHDATHIGVRADDRSGPTSATMSGSLIEDSGHRGLLAIGAEVTVEGSVVRRSGRNALTRHGRGVDVQDSPHTSTRAQLTMNGSLIELSRDVGLFATGSDVTLQGTVVRDTTPTAQEGFGPGVEVGAGPYAQAPGRLTLRGAVLDGNRRAGVILFASEAVVENTVVRNNLPDAELGAGQGLHIQDVPGTGRSSLALRASLIEDSRQFGVFVGGSDATIEASVLRQTSPDSEGTFGHGLYASPNATTGDRPYVTVHSSVVEHHHEIGLLLVATDGAVQSTLVREIVSNAAGMFGRGIGIEVDAASGARSVVSVAGSLVERSREVGLAVVGADATVTGTLVRDILPDGLGESGGGLAVFQSHVLAGPGTLTVQDSVAEANLEFGLFVSDSHATIEHSVLSNTQPNSAGFLGDGVVTISRAAESPPIQLRDSLVHDNARAGVASFGSVVVLEGLALGCNTIHLNGEADYELAGERFQLAFSFDDRGGNACSCAEQAESCVVLSAGLEPPAPP